ncbi:MAG: DUF2914 domain-containing protein [Desulfobacterales bacterium]|jgi:hypothetical protein
MLKHWLTGALLLWVSMAPGGLWAQNDSPPADPGVAIRSSGPLRLSNAVICESLEAFKPLNPSAVFSVRVGSVMCFTAFDQVPQRTSIFHDWIRQDKLVFRKKLVLKTPRWSSVSSIQLREADIGPWRVEIRTTDGEILRILRFSITN